MPARRRPGLVGLAALALGLLAAVPPPAAAADVATPKLSGLPWRSGVSINPWAGEGGAFAA